MKFLLTNRRRGATKQGTRALPATLLCSAAATPQTRFVPHPISYPLSRKTYQVFVPLGALYTRFSKTIPQNAFPLLPALVDGLLGTIRSNIMVLVINIYIQLNEGTSWATLPADGKKSRHF